MFRFVKSSRRLVALLVVQAGVFAVSSVWAQPGKASQDVTDERVEQKDGKASIRLQARYALSAERLMDILQQRPQAMIDVKDLISRKLAEKSQDAIQVGQISDEDLFAQLDESAELRSATTIFLRSRGYLTSDEMREAATQAHGDDGLPIDGTDADRYTQNDALSKTLQPPSLAEKMRLSSDPLRPISDDQAQPAKDLHRANKTTNYQSQREDSASQFEEQHILHQPAPYNLMAMRDLYSQIGNFQEPIKRFGSDVFLRRTSKENFERSGEFVPPKTIFEAPIGPDYVVGAGDTLTIQLWGPITHTLQRTIAPDGRVFLPEAGAVQIAGMTLIHAEEAIAQVLKQQYRDIQVAVAISQLRTIHVYVVGDVQRPGAYDLSSLSSPVNALYAAGGPTSIGSMRTVCLVRGGREVAEIDLYNFLLHGMQRTEIRIQNGDTLLVPAAGKQAAIYGVVKRPAIYELRDEETLAQLIEDAGGLWASASLDHVTVERVDANGHRETATIPRDSEGKADPSAFVVRDGDRIKVGSVLPYSERAVYLEGHVVRPGRIAYHDGIRLNQVLRSYQDLLPEPASRAQIIRLMPPDLHPETIEFNVEDALIGNNNIELRPFDTIHIFGRYEVDSPMVTIGGEVLHPGTYPLSEGMTAAQLVRMAGGFKRDAFTKTADLTSYSVVDGEKVIGERSTVRIGDATLQSMRDADVTLKPGDVLAIHQINGWKDIGASVRIEGEVAHPGSYGIQEGERLSSLLRRAGGFRPSSYPDGAVLVRQQVRELEEKSRAELIRQIETSSNAARLAPNLSGGDSAAALQLIQQQQDQMLARLRSAPPSGRLVIHITADIDAWANTPADIEVRRGDVLTIPKRPGFVLVTGQIYNASAITYTPGKSAGWYLRRAGGATDVANKKEIFVIRAKGTVVGRNSGRWMDADVLGTKLQTGDVIVVPQKIMGASQFWRNLIATAQIASSITIAAAVAGL